MAAAAHNPAFAKKVGVPTSVGKEFLQADKAKGYSTQAKINRPNTAHGKLDMPFHSVQSKAKGGEMKESKAMMKKEVAFMQKKGAPKSMIKHEKAEAKGMKFARGGGIESRGKTKGKMIKMAKGGRAC
jgi:expansin (peptidoglycan-binding protein)